MRYLFFDIECANCFNGQGKICSFGYVITDTQFNILEQKDILMNPKTKFHFTKQHEGEEGIELGYPLEMFTSSPDFEYYYDTIRKLLTYEDQIVFGHSVLNDIHFLNSECKRYDMPYFAYKAYDTQVLYMLLHNDAMPAALAKICTAYEVDVTDLHRSDFDSYLTMQVLSHLCQEYKTTLEGLFERFPNASYSVADDGKVTNNFATVSNTKKLFDYARHIPTPKLAPKTNVASLHFCFNKEFEDDFYKKALYLVREIRLNGGYYCTKPSRCEYYVRMENVSKESDDRVKQMIEEGHRIKVLEKDEFLKMLGIDDITYNKIEDMSISQIKQKK